MAIIPVIQELELRSADQVGRTPPPTVLAGGMIAKIIPVRMVDSVSMVLTTTLVLVSQGTQEIIVRLMSMSVLPILAKTAVNAQMKSMVSRASVCCLILEKFVPSIFAPLARLV